MRQTADPMTCVSSPDTTIAVNWALSIKIQSISLVLRHGRVLDQASQWDCHGRRYWQ